MNSEHPGASSGGGGGLGFSAMDKRKSAVMFGPPEEEDGGVDELLAALGYKVRASDMADVAQKLEQLEMAMGGTAASAPNDDASIFYHLSSDTVHYNPSDLSTWLDSMLSEINLPPPPPPATTVPRNHFQQQSGQEAPCHLVLPPLPPPATTESSVITNVGDYASSTSRRMSDGTYDLKPIPPALSSPTGPGRASYALPDPQSDIVSPRDRKRMRFSATPTATTTCSSSSSSRSGIAGGVLGSSTTTTEVASLAKTSSTPAMPVVVVDTQEAGIRLVHALMACAEAIQQENLKAADALVKQISVLSASQGGAMRKVAGYFAEALARRIYRPRPAVDLLDSLAFADLLHMHFYESCPYLKFAHFTANQAILEAFAGCRRVHVIDFGMKQGMQWPALLQALALRPGGPPSFRLTGIGPPQPDQSDALQQVGWKLAHLAETIHVDFRYRGFVAASLSDIEPYMLLESPDSGDKSCSDDGDEWPEVVAVNSVFELHRLLARPGALEKVLATVRALRPRIVTVVEQEANHNAASFVDRFTEALHYYSTMFDSLEGGASGSEASSGDASSPGGGATGGGQQDQMMSEVYLGQQICNVVACEGVDRTERHERLDQWRGRMNRAGFEPVHLGSNAYKQASMLLALYAGGDGYRVEEKDGCLTLGWHTRPLIATSAWRVSGGHAPAAIAASGR